MNYIGIFCIGIYLIILIFFGIYDPNVENKIYDITISTTTHTDINLLRMFTNIVIPFSFVFTVVAFVLYIHCNYLDDKIEKGNNVVENTQVRDKHYNIFIIFMSLGTIFFIPMMIYILYIKYKANLNLPSVSSTPAKQTANI